MMFEVNVHRLVDTFDPATISASAAELGNDAGNVTVYGGRWLRFVGARLKQGKAVAL